MSKFDENELKETFKSRDKNGDGSLDLKEIEEMLKEIFAARNDTGSQENVDLFLEKFDLNGDKKVSLEEFIKAFKA